MGGDGGVVVAALKRTEKKKSIARRKGFVCSCIEAKKKRGPTAALSPVLKKH